MLDTRNCCAGDIPEELANIKIDNYRLRTAGKIIVAIIIVSGTIAIYSEIISNLKRKASIDH